MLLLLGMKRSTNIYFTKDSIVFVFCFKYMCSVLSCPFPATRGKNALDKRGGGTRAFSATHVTKQVVKGYILLVVCVSFCALCMLSEINPNALV